MTDRKPIFDAFREFMGGHLTQPETDAFNAFLDRFRPEVGTGAAKRKVGPLGIALMHRWEDCKLNAYPDPGSADGKPWTIGWGSTGPDIGPGTVWSQAQADARFEKDLEKYAAEVSKAIGDAPTTQQQFDALVAFHYNTGKIASATLTKRHVARDYEGAAREFRKWVNNDGRPMQGLINRRADEEKLYRSAA